MSRILVTGGAGFIGSHLCERLLNEGNEVICLDNFYSSDPSNVDFLKSNPNFHLLVWDVVAPLDIDVDAIYHLACPASPVHYQRDPVNTVKTSVLGAINMLDLAKKLQVPILFTSTSEVYGDPDIHPQIEEYWGNVNPIGVRACYDEGKRCAETLFFDYYRQYGVDIKVVRIFNTYGPRMHPNDGRVVSNFITQVLAGKSITIYGSGSQTRSFCYVTDMVDGLIKMMGSKFIGPINLGNPDEITVSELASKVKDILKHSGMQSQIEYLPLPFDDPTRRKPDITKARELLDWEPKVRLDWGLLWTLAYFNKGGKK